MVHGQKPEAKVQTPEVRVETAESRGQTRGQGNIRGQRFKHLGQGPGQRSGVQIPEVRGSNTRGQWSEARGQGSNTRGKWSEVRGSNTRDQWSVVKVQTPEVRGSNTRRQWSEARDQGSNTRGRRPGQRLQRNKATKV